MDAIDVAECTHFGRRVYIVRLHDVIVNIYHGSGVLFVAKLEASVSEHKP